MRLSREGSWATELLVPGLPARGLLRAKEAADKGDNWAGALEFARMWVTSLGQVVLYVGGPAVVQDMYNYLKSNPLY